MKNIKDNFLTGLFAYFPIAYILNLIAYKITYYNLFRTGVWYDLIVGVSTFYIGIIISIIYIISFLVRWHDKALKKIDKVLFSIFILSFFILGLIYIL
ncbi:MAG: hypothetical protein WC229_02325 [Candidatus Paceibacterota bacterium]|jgi:hypothetical protein